MTDRCNGTCATNEKIKLLTSSRIFTDGKDTMHHFSAGTLLALDDRLPKNTVKRRFPDVTPEDCEAFIESGLANSLVLSGLAEAINLK